MLLTILVASQNYWKNWMEEIIKNKWRCLKITMKKWTNVYACTFIKNSLVPCWGGFSNFVVSKMIKKSKRKCPEYSTSIIKLQTLQMTRTVLKTNPFSSHAVPLRSPFPYQDVWGQCPHGPTPDNYQDCSYFLVILFKSPIDIKTLSLTTKHYLRSQIDTQPPNC